ncbi:hypothetical protein [Microbacterium sp. lyk4-40-TSB-66]|uniref:hypothetical protein n=1 Tax=Microbacterium sp. lyk4-40-TSB-66 TaxID=3040294 RepID=UPI00254E86F1|nr:hypothetical protein [Microbacterium sp. lyk4-40-TSB-66]
MRRRTAVAAAVGLVVLAGCAPGEANVGPWSEISPIFDRPRTAGDALPPDVGGLDAESSRYVGEDDDGNRYWAAFSADSGPQCILFVPEDDGDHLVFCGGAGLAGETASGLRVEFSSSPNRLSEDDAQLVGDTLLVKTPG